MIDQKRPNVAFEIDRWWFVGCCDAEDGEPSQDTKNSLVFRRNGHGWSAHQEVGESSDWDRRSNIILACRVIDFKQAFPASTAILCGLLFLMFRGRMFAGNRH